MFADLDPIHPVSTGKAFRAILDRKNSVLRSQVPWSSVELKITSDDIDFLNRWLAHGAISALRSASKPGAYTIDPQKGFSNSVVCGALFHLLFSEHVRRHGSEGNYWGCIRQLPWPDEISSDWFVYNGQPTALHRSVLEQSAQALRLRNAFGIEGTCQWFSTGYLQFGFTYKGFRARLPEWLASTSFAPNAVVTLLNEPKTLSPSFQFLWSSLQDYRRGNITETMARQRLAVSPWVLPEWHDDILKISKKRTYLGTGDHTKESEETSQPFLAEPRLRFDLEGQPYFETEIVGLADRDLSASAYSLSINGQIHAAILRQPDGSYSSTSTESIQLPWQTQTTTATLESAVDASIAASQSVTCWLSDELVQVFRADGRRYRNPHAFGARPSAPVWLLHPASLTHDGAVPLEDWSSPDGNWCIRKIDPTTHSHITFDGDSIWSFDDACQQVDSDKEAITQIRAWCDSVIPGAKILTLHFGIEEAVTVRWCRMGLIPIEVPPRGSSISLPFKPEHLERGILLHFGLQHAGRNIRHSLKVSIPFEGAVWYRNGTYHTKYLTVLNSRDGIQNRVRIIPPGLEYSNGPDDFSLLEGSRIIRRLGNDSFSPGHLSGLGAPLDVYRGPFNADRPSLKLAHAVVDGGLIHQVKISSEHIKIIPMAGIVLRPDLEFVIWVGGNDHAQQIQSIAVEKTTAGAENHPVWTSPNLFQNQSINALAVFLEDSCVGWWWNLGGWTRTPF